MTAWELPVLCAVSVLGGIKSICGYKLLKGKDTPLIQVWTDQWMYVLSGIFMAFYGLLWLGFGKSPVMIRSADLLFTYGILAVVDGKCKIVPDSILACYFAGQMLLGAFFMAPAALLQLFFQGVLFTAIAFTFAWISKGKMGMGDVRLLGVTAMTAGWGFALQIFMLAVVLSFFYSIWLIIVCKRAMQTEFPFVPFLAVSLAVYMVFIK